MAMLYLRRKIDAFLDAWKANPDRKPLIVKGPRQVGKTESINRFAEVVRAKKQAEAAVAQAQRNLEAAKKTITEVLNQICE